jgi:hypothetical protein
MDILFLINYHSYQIAKQSYLPLSEQGQNISDNLFFAYTQDIFTSSFLVSANLGGWMVNELGWVFLCLFSAAWGHGTRGSPFIGLFISCQLYSPSPPICRMGTGSIAGQVLPCPLSLLM